MSDWIAHGYFTIKADVVWNAIEVELPLVMQMLQNFQDECRP